MQTVRSSYAMRGSRAPATDKARTATTGDTRYRLVSATAATPSHTCRVLHFALTFSTEAGGHVKDAKHELNPTSCMKVTHLTEWTMESSTSARETVWCCTGCHDAVNFRGVQKGEEAEARESNALGAPHSRGAITRLTIA